MYIAVHVPQFQDPWEFFPDIEAIFRAGGGTPALGQDAHFATRRLGGALSAL